MRGVKDINKPAKGKKNNQYFAKEKKGKIETIITVERKSIKKNIFKNNGTTEP